MRYGTMWYVIWNGEDYAVEDREMGVEETQTETLATVAVFRYEKDALYVASILRSEFVRMVARLRIHAETSLEEVSHGMV